MIRRLGSRISAKLARNVANSALQLGLLRYYEGITNIIFSLVTSLHGEIGLITALH